MKKWIVGSVVVLVVVLGFMFCCNDKVQNEVGVIERSFDRNVVAPGEVVMVELDIRLGEGQSYYLLEEAVPEGVVALNDVAKNNKIRLVKIQGAESNVFSYEVEMPSEKGVYVFAGEYGMEGVDGTRDIGGENSVSVE